MRILIVEDELALGNLLKANLEAESYAVDLVCEGQAALHAALTNEYDAILLDDILPGKRGSDICRELRRCGKTTPILFMSMHVGIETRVQLLDAGADDYLPKPFAYSELSARLRALLRRPRSIKHEEQLRVGDLTLDITAASASRGGEYIYLTVKEFSLLQYLMRNTGQLVTRAMIFEHVWSDEANPLSNMIDTHIHNLRKKIDRPGYGSFVKTLSGRGYIVMN